MKNEDTETNDESTLEAEGDTLAIKFAEWVETLRPSERVSVWSKDGQYRGLYSMDKEQLLAKFKRLKQKGII